MEPHVFNKQREDRHQPCRERIQDDRPFTYALRRAGVPANEARIVRAITWLKSNQRANGGWLTRSQNSPNHHHSISRAGSA